MIYILFLVLNKCHRVITVYQSIQCVHLTIIISLSYFLGYHDCDRLIDGCISTTTLTHNSYSTDYQWTIIVKLHMNNCLTTSWQEHVLFQHVGLDWIVLAHWNNTPRVHISPQIIQTPNQTVFTIKPTFLAYFKVFGLILLRIEHTI